MAHDEAVARDAPMLPYLVTNQTFNPILINPKQTAEEEASPKAPFLT
jgi:hypothetical protein